MAQTLQGIISGALNEQTAQTNVVEEPFQVLMNLIF